MRNLKKVLSLTLALVMLLGMMVVGAGAVETSFKDDSEIGEDYKEAVAVMSALGIINGMDEDHFAPQGTLTRGQAAKIVCYMVLGKSAADKLGKITDSTVFADVDGHWAAGYIEACASMGIVDGVGDNRFDPEGTLTGTAFAKMVLTALEIEGVFTGPEWEKNVRLACVRNNLPMPETTAMSREKAADMAFRGLNVGEATEETNTKFFVASTDVVLDRKDLFKKEDTTDSTKYTTGTDDVTFADVAGDVNGVTAYDSFSDATAAGSGVVFGYKAPVAPSTARTAYTAQYGKHFTVSSMSVTETVRKDSLGYKNFGLASKTEKDSDDYGNPVQVWVKDGKPLFTVDTGATLAYTEKVTGGKLYTDLGLKSALAADKLTYIVDGKEESKPTISSGSTSVVAGNGALTKVYKAADGKYTITVVNTYVAKVQNWYKATTNADGQVVKGSEERISLTALSSGVTMDSSVNQAGKVYNRFETTDFTKDDAGKTVVLFTIKYNNDAYNATKNPTGGMYEIDTVVVPETVNATATRLIGNKSFVADGITYNYAAKAANPISSLNGKEQTLYLDAYDNVIYTSAPDTSKNYAVILGLESTGGSGSGSLGTSTDHKVQLLLPDASVVLVSYKIDNSTYTAYSSAGSPALYDVITYSEGSDGVYTLTKKTDAAAGITDIYNNKPAMTGYSAALANSKTIFLVKNNNDNLTSYTAYTGIGSVPTVTGIANNGTLTNNQVTRVVQTGGVAELVFVSNGTATNPTGTSDLTFIAAPAPGAKADVELDANNKAVYTFQQWAVVNGEIVEVTVKGTDIDTSVVASNTLSATVTRDGDVIVSASSLATGLTNGTGRLDVDRIKAVADNNVVTLKKGLSDAGTAYLYDGDTKTYLVKDGKIEEKDITDVVTTNTIVAAYVVNNKLTQVFYIESAPVARDELTPAGLTGTKSLTENTLVSGSKTLTTGDNISVADGKTLTIDGDLELTNTSTLNLNTSGKLVVTGNLTFTAGTLSVAAGTEITVTGKTSLDADATVAGTLHANGGLDIGGDVTLSNTVTATTVTVDTGKTLTVSGTLTATSTVTITGTAIDGTGTLTVNTINDTNAAKVTTNNVVVKQSVDVDALEAMGNKDTDNNTLKVEVAPTGTATASTWCTEKGTAGDGSSTAGTAAAYTTTLADLVGNWKVEKAFAGTAADTTGTSKWVKQA